MEQTHNLDYNGYIVLRDLYKNYFKIGVACEAINERNSNSEIGNEAKERLIAAQFGSITFGNELKPAYNMDFDCSTTTEEFVSFTINPKAKEMLDWAKAHHMPVRGHVLTWHSQCSNRVFCKGYEPVFLDADKLDFEKNPMARFFAKLDPSCFADRATMIKRISSYIDNVMKYMFQNGYAQTIYAWDVVNEAIEWDDKNPTGLRNSYWYQTIGEDFMFFCFKAAREASVKYAKEYASLYQIDAHDETAIKSIMPKLFYNDYNEWMPKNSKAIIDALQRETNEHGSILGEGLIDGIGMQGHLSDNNNLTEYIDALKLYSQYVGDVHITELDVKQTCTNINAEYYQAVFYQEFLSKLIKANAEGAHLTCVTLWGLTDDNSWIRGANPLIFNGDLTKKKAFDGMVYAITGEDLGEPVDIPCNISDRNVTFTETSNLEDLYFKVRGAGKISVETGAGRNGKAALKVSERRGPWSGLNYDVSDFLGQTIEISAWIKTKADTISLNADINGPWPMLGKVDTSSGEWTQLKATYKIPANLYSLVLYFAAEEKMMTSNDIYIDELQVQLVGLQEGFEEETNIAAVRGAGHLPFLYVTDKESIDGKGHSLCVTRQEKDATIKFSVSPYIGKNVKIQAYVKTTDQEIMFGLDGPASKEIARFKSVLSDITISAAACTDACSIHDDACSIETNGFTKISAEFMIPEGLKTADLYLETSGNADFYVDDIFVSLA